jgi:hypothetical protein
MPAKFKINVEEYKEYRKDPTLFCDNVFNTRGPTTLTGPNGKVIKVIRALNGQTPEISLPHKNGLVNTIGTPLPTNCECVGWTWVNANHEIIPRESESHHPICRHAEKWKEIKQAEKLALDKLLAELTLSPEQKEILADRDA